MKRAGAMLMTAILAACGGGGGGADDTAVSATPPAAAPTPGSEPAPAPSPSPTPVPVPVPVPTPTPVPAPAQARSDTQISLVVREEMAKLTLLQHDESTMQAWVTHFRQPQFNALSDAAFRQAVFDQAVTDKARYGWPDLTPSVTFITGAEIFGSLRMNYNPTNSPDFAVLREGYRFGELGTGVATVSQAIAFRGYDFSTEPPTPLQNYTMASTVDDVALQSFAFQIGHDTIGPELIIGGAVFTRESPVTIPHDRQLRFQSETEDWRIAQWTNETGAVMLRMHGNESSWVLCWQFYGYPSRRQICNHHRSSDNVHIGASMIEGINDRHGRTFESLR